MVFGWRAAPFSIAGKLMGAGTAFGLRRGACFTRGDHRQALAQLGVAARGDEPEFSPWARAFLMKYSCFPELAKNFGSTFLRISPVQLATATLVHGGSSRCCRRGGASRPPSG
jgi:hypothetical protein